MNKKLLLTVTILIYSHLLTAQVLYTENFNNFTLGNVGTDPNGIIPGQGGWLTEGMNTDSKDNSLFTITNEPNKGKVLTFNATPPDRHILKAKKADIDKLIDNRTPGYNVLKFELDYFTGLKSSVTTHSNGTNIIIASNNGTKDIVLFIFSFTQNSGNIAIQHNSGDNVGSLVFGSFSNYLSLRPILPYNTWTKLTVYLDYTNQKIYFENSNLSNVAVSDSFLSLSNSSNLIQDFKPTSIYFQMNSTHNYQPNVINNKFDNIIITALNKVPAHLLSNDQFLAEEFNVYPNPATTVVNITNNVNNNVDELVIYDTAGKIVKSKKTPSVENIRLNVEDLANGNYLLYLKTNKGTAVKKIIKK